MKKHFLMKTSYTLILTGILSACGSDSSQTEPGETVFDDTNTVIRNLTDGDDNPGDNFDNNQDDDNNQNNGNNQANNNGNQNNNNGGQRNARSPQGIPNNGNQRRDNARANRGGNGQGLQGILIDNRDVRSYDGSGNNQQFTEWGSTFSHLQRLASADYADGISSMIYTDRSGPREISNAIVNQLPGEQVVNVYGTSDFNWQWGQFIDHDIDLTDGSADEPQNIPVPIGDAYFDPTRTGTVVIPFNRALYDPDTGTGPNNVREQENEITSWIDGSMIYGSTNERAAALRVGPDSPFLATSAGNLLPFNTQSLTNANGPVPDPTTLFIAGDIRVNEQVGLSVMHTLWVREHNRIAQILQDQANEQGTNADAETIFQAARRLVVAKLQIITYNEYLPALLGPNAIPEYNGYNPSINPTIYNEFSAAAFRLGHSMVSERLLRLDENGNEIDAGHLDLAQAFFTAPSVIRSQNDIDPILRGLAAQDHQSIDVQVIHPLRNLLFGRPGAGGLDLTALNIQRGRDHGLPGYNDMRIALNLSPVSSFDQVTDDPTVQQSLQDAYGDVSNIDLWMGGLAETPLSNQGSQLGELFHTIITRQFTELRDGDRFWYQNELNDEELDFVENTTLADVIRSNTNIGNELQDNVFYTN